MPDSDDRIPGDFEILPDQMLHLSCKTTEFLVECLHGLPEEKSWEGDFRKSFESGLQEESSEIGCVA